MKYLFPSVLISLFAFQSSAMPETGPLGYGEPAFKQEMETDRPDFTEGTQSIDPGHIQFESGYTYAHDSTDSHVLPELLIRAGMIEDFEFRLAWAGYIFEANDSSGTSDMSLGFKQHLMTAGGCLPSFSYILETGLPVGSDNQTAGELEPALKLLWAFDLSEGRGVAGNLNFASRSGDQERFFETSASVTYSIPLSDELGIYTEYFGIYPYGGASGEIDEHYLNEGLTYALSKDTQLDARIGLGLNGDSANMFTGVGLSWRI